LGGYDPLDYQALGITMTEAIAYFLLGILLFGVVLGLNKWSNQIQMDNCEKKGGTFYYSADSKHSLCQLPK